MNYELIVASLLDLSESELSSLNRAVVAAIRAKRSGQSAVAISRLNLGQTVRLNASPGSKYNGLTGQVVKVNRTKVIIQTSLGRVRAPATMVAPA